MMKEILFPFLFGVLGYGIWVLLLALDSGAFGSHRYLARALLVAAGLGVGHFVNYKRSLRDG